MDTTIAATWRKELLSSDVGITVLLAIIGILITGILVIKKCKRKYFMGNPDYMAVRNWICQFAGLYVPNPDVGFYSLLPDFSNGLCYSKSCSDLCKARISKAMLFTGLYCGRICIPVCRYV